MIYNISIKSVIYALLPISALAIGLQTDNLAGISVAYVSSKRSQRSSSRSFDFNARVNHGDKPVYLSPERQLPRAFFNSAVRANRLTGDSGFSAWQMQQDIMIRSHKLQHRQREIIRSLATSTIQSLGTKPVLSYRVPQYRHSI